jgi:hypothetical protein
MVKWIAPLTIALRIAVVALAISWTYASHKYDCLNIGPCNGNISLWVNLNTVACYGFLFVWLSLIALAWFTHARSARHAITIWVLAVLAPPSVVVLAFSVFNMGVSATVS